jgi:competence protein ComEC
VTAFGPVVLAGALVAGILAGEQLGPARAIGVLGLTVAAAFGTALVPRRRRLALAVIAIALFGAASMQRALDGLVHSPLTALVDARASVTVKGTLLDDPGGPPYRAEALMRVAEVMPAGQAARSAGGRRVLVSASGAASGRLRVLSAGDSVTLEGWLGPLRDFDRHLRWRHAVGRLDARDLLAFGDPQSLLWRVANTVRSRVLGGSASLPPAERALVAGFLLGDTRGIPVSVEHEFRAAGLTHLLAVSGANVAFVLSLAAPALRRLGLRGRLVGGLGVLVLFGTMTRWEPSVLRATTMAGAAMVALHLGRPTAGLRVLALGAGLLLAIDPFLVHSVGFLLSCSASAGILVLGPRFVAWLRGPEWAREALGVSAAAQIGVAPVLIPVFGSMPLVALPANLLVAPAVGPLTVGGLIAGVAGGIVGPWSPDLARLLEVPVGLLVRWVMVVADLAARVPVAVDGRAAFGLLALGACAAAAIRTRRLRGDAPVPAR